MVLEYQELHIAEDIWLNDVNRYLSKNADYCEGSEDYHITLNELYEGVFPEDDLSRIGRPQQMRLANILRKLGFEKKRVMIDRDRVTYWKLSDEKIKELQANHLKQTKDEETQAEEDWGKI